MPDDQITLATSKEASQENRFVDKRRSNVKSDLIEITEDKLETILLKHLTKIETRNRWFIPMTLLVTVSITMSTATFGDSLGLSAATWEALFLLTGLGSFIWLGWAFCQWYQYRNQLSLRFLIGVVKNSQKEDKG